MGDGVQARGGSEVKRPWSDLPGRSDELACFLAEHTGRLERLAFWACDHRQWAQDAAEDIVIKFWERGLGHVDSDVETYLNVAVVNKARSILRGEHARGLRDLRHGESKAPVDPEDEAVRADEQRRLLDEIERLPADEYFVIQCRYHEGMTFAQIAPLIRNRRGGTGVADSRARQLHGSALAQLKRRLEAE
jgi:RNA polymerase sigma factor (sigma-70 family)